MVKPVVKLKIDDSTLEKLKYTIENSLELISKTDILVGIPQKESSRDGEDINNAELLFIHTNGSPKMGIPPRPVLQPAIEQKDTRWYIIQHLNEAVKSLLQNDEVGFFSKLEAAGMIAQNASREWFVNPANNWPPNKPATVKAKAKRAGLKVTAGFIDRPLIDTGEMRKSIVYVIRRQK